MGFMILLILNKEMLQIHINYVSYILFFMILIINSSILSIKIYFIFKYFYLYIFKQFSKFFDKKSY